MFVKNKLSNYITKITVVIVLFFLAIGVWYFPIMFKGYSPVIFGSSYLVRAKNLANANIYGSENNLNVIISSEQMKSEGHISNSGKKLSSYIYSFIIEKFNANTNEKIFLTSCIISAMALLFFFLTIFFLFGFRVASYFGIIYIFLPANLTMPIGSHYPVPILFISLFIFFFVLGFIIPNKNPKMLEVSQKSKFTKTNNILNLYLLLSGVFLALACLSNEVFLLILPVLFFYLLFLKFKKQTILIFAPLALIISIFWLPNFLSGQNTYTNFFSNKTTAESKYSDYDRFAHIFPDPYTYHYSKDEYIQENLNQIKKAGPIGKITQKRLLHHFGYAELNIFEKFVTGTVLLTRHLFRFFSMNHFGGPFILLLFILGMHKLKNKNKILFNFYFYWIAGSLLLMSYFLFVQRNHLPDYNHILALGIALGVIYLSSLIANKQPKKNLKLIIQLILIVAITYNFFQLGRQQWGGWYNEQSLKNKKYINIINNFNTENNKVIAVPFAPNLAYNLNFTSDNSIVAFREDTFKKIINEEKVNDVINDFNIGYIFGYSPELSEKIQSQTEVTLIKDEINKENKNTNSEARKSWLMNIVR